MSETLKRVISLIAEDKYRVSQHAMQELINDGLLIGPIIDAVATAELLEDYPDYHKGPALLILQFDENGFPIHLVWGIPKSKSEPAVLVTAYRPDPELWSANFTRRVER